MCVPQQTCHGAVQFTVYEELKHAAAGSFGAASTSESDRPISSFETSVYAATSKLSASIITYPSQVGSASIITYPSQVGSASIITYPSQVGSMPRLDRWLQLIVFYSYTVP